MFIHSSFSLQVWQGRDLCLNKVHFFHFCSKVPALTLGWTVNFSKAYISSTMSSHWLGLRRSHFNHFLVMAFLVARMRILKSGATSHRHGEWQQQSAKMNGGSVIYIMSARWLSLLFAITTVCRAGMERTLAYVVAASLPELAFPN